MGRRAEDDHIVHPFENMPDTMMSQNVEQSVSWGAFNATSGC